LTTKLPPSDIVVPFHVAGTAFQLTLAPFEAQLPVHAHELADTCEPEKLALAEPADDVTAKLTLPGANPASACDATAHPSAHAVVHKVILSMPSLFLFSSPHSIPTAVPSSFPAPVHSPDRHRASGALHVAV
jgi:hypothetical protein